MSAVKDFSIAVATCSDEESKTILPLTWENKHIVKYASHYEII